jgi:hypothetical protein
MPLALVVFWTLEMAYLSPTDGRHHAYGSFSTKEACEEEAHLLIKHGLARGAKIDGPTRIDYSCVRGEGDDRLREYLRGRP